MATRNVKLDEFTHTYYVDGKPARFSVTEVIDLGGGMGKVDYPEHSGDDGTRRHKMFADFARGTLHVDAIDADDAGHLVAYQKFRRENLWRSVHIEEPIYSEIYDIAGQPDDGWFYVRT